MFLNEKDKRILSILLEEEGYIEYRDIPESISQIIQAQLEEKKLLLVQDIDEVLIMHKNLYYSKNSPFYERKDRPFQIIDTEDLIPNPF